ncbi:DUF2207 domain-containing protein [Ihubacter sp. mB4P-1]|uniref:DUF2207 domain-containing protein n=1 Tax=Ihubacter sp. mB4P-1 TaxID=3242370 RepID=UPI003C7BEA15
MRRMRRLFCALIAVALLLSCCLFSSASVYAASGYETDRFDVEMTVEENHVIHVTETIKVDFKAARHGIFRYVPFEDGIYTIKNLRAEGEPYSTETIRENGTAQSILKVGDADRTITGKHTYIISYDIVGYEDKTADADFLAVDVLPTGWESSIKKVSVKVSLPKPIDPARVEVYSGSYGLEGNPLQVKANYHEKDNTITLHAENLYQGAGITLRAELPEGYWQGAANRDWLVWLLTGALIALPLIMGLLWLMFGRDTKIVKTVEFYPPQDLTPAEIGYIIDDIVDNKDLASMIMYYADKGWLSVREYTRDQFELTRLTSIDPKEKAFSKTLFHALFEEGDVVRMDQLPKGFSDQFLAARDQLKSWYSGDRVLTTTASKVIRGIGMALMFVPAIASITAGSFFSFNYLWMIALIPSIILLLIGLCMDISVFDRRDVYSKGKKLLLSMIGSALGLIGLGIGAGVVAISMEQELLALLTLVSGIVTFIFVLIMGKRTDYGAKLQGQILGFRNFIETAELEKLELLVEDDPEYFFNILPYAYVMGLSDKWAKKFENIRLEAPSYYSGYGGDPIFTAMWYSHMFRSCSRGFTDSVTKSMIASSGDSGGRHSSGFGGGGFSGGGFGGGGGGSW